MLGRGASQWNMEITVEMKSTYPNAPFTMLFAILLPLIKNHESIVVFNFPCSNFALNPRQTPNPQMARQIPRWAAFHALVISLPNKAREALLAVFDGGVNDGPKFGF